MQFFNPVLNIISICINLFAVLILLWGVLVCGKNFFRSRMKLKKPTEKMILLADTKNQLGIFVLFSLELLIVADIIDTVVKPDWSDLIKLGATVAIRTVMSHFLNKEIKENPFADKNFL